VLIIVTGASNVVPGGPDIYVALSGNEKEFDRARTPTIETRCKNPAITLNLRIPLSEFSID
jgi:hypothetical protein